jgi:alanine dehydrogenase
MKIFILKETKNGENRVSVTPHGVAQLVSKGHTVFVDRDAGLGSGYLNQDYQTAGAEVAGGNLARQRMLEQAEMFAKVKEPIPEEYAFLKDYVSGKTLVAYLHLASNPELAKHLVENNITGVSYDTLEDESGRLPLLKPMSEIAGRFAIDFWSLDIAARKVKKALILGGGVSGESAAQRAVDLGIPDIVIYEPNMDRAVQLQRNFEDSQVDIFACRLKLPKEIIKTDLLVGCVLVKGAKTPIVVGPDLVDLMAPGGRIIDVSIDQGGCVWGSRPTSHAEPTYVLNDKVYCCIPNMPGQRPAESTVALTKATFEHILGMADSGVMVYLNSRPGLSKAINTHGGAVVNETIKNELARH